mmetsp:Transcript_7623/g.8615  ORF Transcript_7623/g.8615 Transcript_7623/m.8615 type:complete len:92 (-) Transcript_7623:20-295(-)
MDRLYEIIIFSILFVTTCDRLQPLYGEKSMLGSLSDACMKFATRVCTEISIASLLNFFSVSPTKSIQTVQRVKMSEKTSDVVTFQMQRNLN